MRSCNALTINGQKTSASDKRDVSNALGIMLLPILQGKQDGTILNMFYAIVICGKLQEMPSI
jgi:hypothetical protein